MSALEQELIDRIRKLDEAQQQKILEYIQDVEEKEEFDFDAWIEKARAFRARISATYGKPKYFGVQAMLDEIREEASWPRW